MSIERVMTLLPLPDQVVEASGHTWSAIENEIGTPLPSDYKAFLDNYGTGTIGEFLWILNPCSVNPNLNMEKARYFWDSYRQMKETFPEDYPREVGIMAGSFLVWAVTDNGDSLFWVLDEGDPDGWLVGIHSADQGEEELRGLTMSAFLEALLDRKLSSSILPKEFIASKKFFRPI